MCYFCNPLKFSDDYLEIKQDLLGINEIFVEK